jgi:hypothetical protein
MEDLYRVARFHNITSGNIAIINVTVSKTVVCQGYSAKVNVTITNSFDSLQKIELAIYFNSSTVKMSQISLDAQSSTMVTLTVIPRAFLFEEIWRSVGGTSTGNIGNLTVIGDDTFVKAMTGNITFGNISVKGGIIELRYSNGSLIKRMELLIHPDETNTVFTAGKYGNGLYVIGTTDGRLYFLDNKGESGELTIGTMPVNNIQIEGSDITVSTRNEDMLLRRCSTDFTLSKGNYTISARVSEVPGEIDYSDNRRTDDSIYVSMVGDVNADGKVDLKDIYFVGKAYGTIRGAGGQYWHTPPRPCCPHSPNYDINDDGKIDLKDYYTT